MSVLFADVAGFWAPGALGAGGRSTAEVVTLMNEMYSAFEKLLAKHQVRECVNV